MNKRIVSVTAVGLVFTVLTPAAVAQSSPSLYSRATRYDAMGRVTGTIAPSASNNGQGYSGHLAVRTTYDPAGRPIKVESGYLSSWQSETVAPASWSGFTIMSTLETTYDAAGRKLTERLKGSDSIAYALTQYSYDAIGRLECTAQRMNPAVYGSITVDACTLFTPGTAGTAGDYGSDRITRNIYDAAGQLVQVREGVGAGSTIEAAEVTYTYTPNGKIEHVIDAGGHKARKCYDGFDRLTRWVFPSTTSPAFNDTTLALTLSSAGAVNGDCTTIADPVNQDDYEEYGYDANGNRTALRKRDGSLLTYQYDSLNRMRVKVVPDRAGLDSTHERDVYYGYDLRGLRTSVRFDSTSGEGVTFGYDAVGRKISETLSMDGVSRTLTSQYDRNGNRLRLFYPDGHYIDHNYDGLDRPYHSLLNGTSSLFHTPFDSAGRLQSVYRWNTATASWANYTVYYYDAVSRLSAFSMDVAGSSHDIWSTSFSYNPASQIASTTRTNDVYTWNGQVTVNRNYTANGLNQYSAVGGTSFSHDANGNLTSDGTNTYTYDVENRMVASTTGTSSYTFRYDPLGRLYEHSFYNGGVFAWATRWLHEGDKLLAEYSPAGTMYLRYFHGPWAGDVPLGSFNGTTVDTRRYFYADERGSIIAETLSDGTVNRLTAYDEYGIPKAGFSMRFGYTGQAAVAGGGLWYYRARIYSPTLGRFMQTDPIGYDDQFNLYAYVGNDPVNAIDPTGEDSYYVQRAAGPFGAGAHGFVVVADRPGGKIQAIFSFTHDPSSDTLRNSSFVPEQPTLERDIDAWNSIREGKARNTGTTFNRIDASDDQVVEAGRQVTRALERDPIPYGTFASGSSCNSNCAAAAVADIASERAGNGNHVPPGGGGFAPGTEIPNSEKVEDRVREGMTK